MLRAIAWLGGVLFAGSQGYTVYFYLVVLAEPAPAGSSFLPAALVNLGLFSAFALHHSLLARAGAKRALTAALPARIERSLYVWIASLLWLSVCLWWRPVAGTVYAAEGLLRWALYGAQLVGVWLTIRGAGVIDSLELAGIRQASGEIVTTDFKVAGPFRFVRHPIYLGWLLMVFGAPLMTMNRLLFAVVSSTYLILAIPWEERSLVASFGDRYRSYQQQVRWRLLPGIW